MAEIRIGCCIGTKDLTEKTRGGQSLAAALLKSGFDYVETALNAVAAMSAEDFAAFKSDMDIARVEAFNSFFPGHIRLTGADADMNAVSAYLDTALKRASALGAEIIVFGSGGARKFPEGFSKETAFGQLASVCRLISEKAAPYNITVAIEPLNKTETNIINSVKEGFELVRAADRPNIRLLADYYHIAFENEPVSDVVKYGAALKHLHYADLEGRRLPTAPNDGLKGFIKAAKDAGYKGRVSFEAGAKDDYFTEAVAALKILKKVSGK